MCYRRNGMISLIVVRIVMGVGVREVTTAGKTGIGEAERTADMTTQDMVRMMTVTGGGVTEVTEAEGGRERAEGT
jgi:hypothetical protein